MLSLYIASAYVATSAFLFCFPTFMHNKHQLTNYTLSQTLK